jgi:hypothetical protein
MPMLGSLSPQVITGPGWPGRAPWEVIASADSITPHGCFVRITGNTTINTISLPEPYFTGPLYLLNTDASVGATGTSGNIQLATTLTRYKVFVMLYDVSTSKWYPSATS